MFRIFQRIFCGRSHINGEPEKKPWNGLLLDRNTCRLEHLPTLNNWGVRHSNMVKTINFMLLAIKNPKDVVMHSAKVKKGSGEVVVGKGGSGSRPESSRASPRPAGEEKGEHKSQSSRSICSHI